jgi:hypothetical protein
VTVTKDRFPGTREETELLLEDDGSGDPTVAGAQRFVSNRFRFKDNSAVLEPTHVRITDNDTTPRHLKDKLVGDGVTFAELNDGNDEDLKVSIDTSNPGPYLFEINPASLFRSGNAGSVGVEGFAANEFVKNISTYGFFSLRWRRSPATTTKLFVTFAIKNNAGGSDSVRIHARTKPVAVGENIDSVPFSAVAAQDVSVASGSAGDTYEAILILTPADYQQGDQVAINVGRDGSHANDTYNKAIFILTIQGEVV